MEAGVVSSDFLRKLNIRVARLAVKPDKIGHDFSRRVWMEIRMFRCLFALGRGAGAQARQGPARDCERRPLRPHRRACGRVCRRQWRKVTRSASSAATGAAAASPSPIMRVCAPAPTACAKPCSTGWARTSSGQHCLDLFAGSGALGFEALSRGAASVVMVEKSRSVCDALRRNAASARGEKPAIALRRCARIRHCRSGRCGGAIRRGISRPAV